MCACLLASPTFFNPENDTLASGLYLTGSGFLEGPRRESLLEAEDDEGVEDEVEGEPPAGRALLALALSNRGILTKLLFSSPFANCMTTKLCVVEDIRIVGHN